MDKEEALAALERVEETLSSRLFTYHEDDDIDNLRAYINDPGYVRVPVEPTEAMCLAGSRAHRGAERHSIMREAYKAMLSASKGEK